MKISRRGFLAKGGLIVLAALPPLALHTAGTGGKAATARRAKPIPNDHVAAWRRFMEQYKPMC